MISRDNILKLETRQKIYNIILKNPGIHFSEISRKSNIPKTTLLYHLNSLEKIGLIKEVNKEGYKRLYVSNVLSSQEKKILALLRQKIPCRIFLHMIFSYACSRVELSKELELKPDTIQYYLNKMLDMDIIEKAPMEEDMVYPFSDPNRAIIIERKPVGREFFYRLKTETGSLILTYKIMIAHKDSLADKELIQEFIEYYNNLKKLGVAGKELKKYDNKKIIQKDGERKSYVKINNIDSVCDLINDFLKPFFCA